MKKQRQKQIGIDAVIKVQNFLKDAQTEIFQGNRFSITGLASDYRIDSMIATLAVRYEYFNKGVVRGEYTIGDNFDSSQTGAKKLIELARILKIDKSFAKTSNEIGQNQAAQSNDVVTGDVDIVPKIKFPHKGDLTALKRWLSGDEPRRNLFTENEKEFEHKLQIACAIASGCYVQISDNVNHFDFEKSNDYIVLAANDLYSKIKK